MVDPHRLITWVWSTPKQEIPFIADELVDVFPRCVAGEPGKIDKDGNFEYMMVDEAGLTSILTKCIQGNRQEIKELRLENDELKKRNKDIFDRIYELELKLDLLMK